MQYDESFGEYGITEESEQQLLSMASQLTGSDNQQNKQSVNAGQKSTTNDGESSHTYYNED